MEEIERNGYNLNVPRYVSATTQEAPYDLFSVMTGKVSDEELKAFDKIWNQFPALREKLLNKADEYNSFAAVDVRDTVFADADVNAFLADFKGVSEEFRKYLIGTLVNHDAVPSVYNDIVNKLFVDVATRKCEVDVLRLDRLEATANKEKLKAYYNVPIFKAHVKLHQDLKEYIEGRKADNLEGVD